MQLLDPGAPATRRELAAFVLLAIGGAWAIFALHAPGRWWIVQWVMSFPAIAGFALAWLFRREPPRAAGFEWTGAGPWLFAIVYPWAFEALAIALAYLVRAATGDAGFIRYQPEAYASFMYVGERRGWSGVPWRLLHEALVLASLALIAAVYRLQLPERLRAALPPALRWLHHAARALLFAPLFAVYHFGSLAPPGSVGEELGWRGYLVRRLRATPVKAAVVSGLVWAAFHLPVLFGQPFRLGRTAGLLGSIAVAGALFAAVYLRSGSVWPCAALHFTWNQWNPALLGDPYGSGQGIFGGSVWVFNGEGVFGLVINGAIAAALIWRWRRDSARPRATSGAWLRSGAVNAAPRA